MTSLTPAKRACGSNASAFAMIASICGVTPAMSPDSGRGCSRARRMIDSSVVSLRNGVSPLSISKRIRPRA